MFQPRIEINITNLDSNNSIHDSNYSILEFNDSIYDSNDSILGFNNLIYDSNNSIYDSIFLFKSRISFDILGYQSVS